MNKIFLVTVLFLNGEKIEYDRCFGFFFNVENAKNAVENNRCDMHESLYNHIVIEEVGEGISPEVKEIQWYKWDNKKNNYIECTKPKKIENVFNFGIG
jgi:hypothetical protein